MQQSNFRAHKYDRNILDSQLKQIGWKYEIDLYEEPIKELQRLLLQEFKKDVPSYILYIVLYEE